MQTAVDYNFRKAHIVRCYTAWIETLGTQSSSPEDALKMSEKLNSLLPSWATESDISEAFRHITLNGLSTGGLTVSLNKRLEAQKKIKDEAERVKSAVEAENAKPQRGTDMSSINIETAFRLLSIKLGEYAEYCRATSVYKAQRMAQLRLNYDVGRAPNPYFEPRLKTQFSHSTIEE